LFLPIFVAHGLKVRLAVFIATSLIIIDIYGKTSDKSSLLPSLQMNQAFFGSSVIVGHGLPPVTARIGVWLDGVGQAGTYHTAERNNGRTRLHRCRQGIPVNSGTRLEGVLVRIGSRGQDTQCVAIR